MKNKFIIIGLAMGSLGFSQEIVVENLNKSHSHITVIDTTQIDTVKVSANKEVNKITSVQCSGTAKSTGNQCRLKTRHESGQCHHHRN